MREVRTGCQTGGRLCLAAIKDADWFSGTREGTGECRRQDASPNIEDYHFISTIHYPAFPR